MLTDSFRDIQIPVLAAIATAIAAFGIRSAMALTGEQGEKRRKKVAAVKEQFRKKLSGDITITIKDFFDIGRGLGASQSMAADALYQLFAESEGQKEYELIRKLLDDLTKEDPFEALPEVTRPSLARISTLCEQSPQTTDRQLLHPIIKVIEEYQEMKRDHTSMKKQNKISYVVALVSFFIGIVGLIMAFRSPSKDFIESEISQMTSNIVQKVKLQQSTSTNDAPVNSKP